MINQKQTMPAAIAPVVDISIARAASATATASAVASAIPSQEVMDARQESQIWTTFALSPCLSANDIKVTVRQGKATLSGNVGDGVSKDLAQQIAFSVNGIKIVNNDIEVRPDFVPAAPSAERAFAELVNDAAITAAVRSKMLWSRYGHGLSAMVDTQRGTVTLTGNASSAEAKAFAGKLAANTQGAHAVSNQLAVGPVNVGIASPDASDIADSWIDTKVKATLLRSTGTDRAGIAVHTTGGIVRLTGKVNDEAARVLAIELAGHVRGVKSVVSSALTT